MLSLTGCSKKYTNQECAEEICKEVRCDDLDNLDKAAAMIGASLECAKYNNDPKETIKAHS
jgi:hypothetical protein